MFVSNFLFYNTYGLPVLTNDTKCPNQIVCFIGQSADHLFQIGLETWFPPNDDIRKYLLDMKHGSSKNAFWDLNNKKWRKWCKFVWHFLINNTCTQKGHKMSKSSFLCW
jgi:hypothetical protein